MPDDHTVEFAQLASSWRSSRAWPGSLDTLPRAMAVSPLYSADRYTYRLLWSEEKRRYLGVCSEFPDLRYEATSTTDALAGIQRRVADELESLLRARKPHPEPLSVQKFGR